MIFADTHVLAWLAKGDPKLPSAAADQLLNNGFCISAVTAWEYEELRHRGRLPDTVTLALLLDAFASEVIAPPADLWSLSAALPDIHRDPIDRLLIAHCLSSGAVLASAGRAMRRYDIPLLW